MEIPHGEESGLARLCQPSERSSCIMRSFVIFIASISTILCVHSSLLARTNM